MDNVLYKSQLLKRVKFFSALDEFSRNDIAKKLIRCEYKKGEIILKKGDKGSSLFIIDSGKVRIHSDNHTFSFFEPNEIFGEYFIIDKNGHSANASAVENCVIFKMDYHGFKRLMHQEPSDEINHCIMKSFVDRLRKMNDIEEELATKNKKIEKQNIVLEELNATKDKFFQIIAHDLRSPIASLLMEIEYLKETINDLKKEEIKEELSEMTTSTLKHIRLLDNLFNWAQLNRGTMPFHPELLQLKPVIDECTDQLKGGFKRKDLKLKDEILDISVFTDSNMLLFIVRNLLGNAIKFSHRGGEITLRSFIENDFVVIQVIDNGVGMSEEYCEKLFVDNQIESVLGTENEKGSGLGIKLCQEFIAKMNGEISCSSKLGSGSVFTIKLKKSI